MDISNRQALQYLQHIASCAFKEYDFGFEGNKLRYGNQNAPLYNLDNIQVETPIDVYYSDNDNFVSVQDIHDLYKIIGNQLSLNRLIFPKFNHLDFVMSRNVKEVINDCIVEKIHKYEGRPISGSSCENFHNKPIY